MLSFLRIKGPKCQGEIKLVGTKINTNYGSQNHHCCQWHLIDTLWHFMTPAQNKYVFLSAGQKMPENAQKKLSILRELFYILLFIDKFFCSAAKGNQNWAVILSFTVTANVAKPALTFFFELNQSIECLGIADIIHLFATKRYISAISSIEIQSPLAWKSSNLLYQPSDNPHPITCVLGLPSR